MLAGAGQIAIHGGLTPRQQSTRLGTDPVGETGGLPGLHGLADHRGEALGEHAAHELVGDRVARSPADVRDRGADCLLYTSRCV